MRTTMVAFTGAAALALGSAAGAAVTVTGSTGLNNPDPAAAGSIQTVGTTTSINFGQNPTTSSAFTASFNIVNTLAGVYSIILGTSDLNTTFTSATLTGPGACVAGCALSLFPDSTNLKLFPTSLLAGTYNFSLAGNNTVVGGSFTGNVTINESAVPEPGTWGMMLLGFGAMGVTLRSRRRQVFAQIA